jgi:D-alanyl-D-alanine carboxypeptidase (penicillin-binding protein 5/6)
LALVALLIALAIGGSVVARAGPGRLRASLTGQPTATAAPKARASAGPASHPTPSASSSNRPAASPGAAAQAAPRSPLSTTWLAAHGQPGLDVRAQAAALVDVGAGQILWARDTDTPRAPASLTKLVTALVVMDLAPVDRQITVTSAGDVQAAQREEPTSTVMGLQVGETLTVRELLYGLFLVSGNDAADTLAAGTVGVPRFLDLMNRKVAALGMTHSHFTSVAGGVDDPGLYVSAADVAVAAAAIVSRYPALLAISGTPRMVLPQTATHHAYDLENINRVVLPGNQYSYPGATGMKTAFTDGAGSCQVQSAQRGQRRLVVVLLHTQDALTGFDNARQLLDYGFSVNPA